MKNFFVILFSKFYMLLKDDFSAMAVLAYFLSLNIFTVIGYYKILFQHSSLNEVPLFYAFIIMFFSGVFTQLVILRKLKQKLYLKKTQQSSIAKRKTETWITLIYMVSSFALMLSVV